MKWDKVRLGDAATFRGGGTPRKDVPEYWCDEIPWVTVKDFKSLTLNDAQGSISKKGLESSSANLIPAGHVIIPTRMALGKAAINTVDLAINQDLRALIPKVPLDSSYLLYSMLGLAKTIERHGSGATVKGITQKKLAELQIPLPPLAEQKRIAGILDAADALRAKRCESLTRLDTFLQSTFLDLFGDPVTNPMGWDKTTLPEISTKFTDGPFGSNLKSSHYVEKGVRVIRLQNVGVGEMLNDDLAFISHDHFASLPRNHCRPGDVIIGTLGDPNLRACVVPPDLKQSLNKADCILMRVEESKAINSYVCWLLNCPPMVTKAVELVRGQTRGRISMGRLKELEVPLPSLDLQRHFATIVESVERQKARMRAHLAELDALFASLQSRAFNGEL